MRRRLGKVREEARRLFLASEITTNVEIAARLKVKPHTVGRWRKDEDWDSLRMKIDRKAAEMFVEKIATDRVTLNVRHYRVWELLVARLLEELKGKASIDIRDLERIAGVLDRAQKGQRLAKGMAVAGETEEAIKAESQAEVRRLIDTFVEAIKENVPDEEARERIRQSVLNQLPVTADEGAGEPQDALAE
jgi:hypothetical protein